LRLALFGGTFDPIHDAHLRIAREAARTFRLDKVLLIPASRPPHKEGVTRTSYEHRYRMVEIATQREPLCKASRLDESGGSSYSIWTIQRARADMKPGDQLYFLIGADAFAEIHTWHRWREVLSAVEFIVVSRPGATFERIEGARVHRLDGLDLTISSSEVRRKLAAGEPVPELMPGVREYIRRNELYQAAPADANASDVSNHVDLD
jgi:nicotinate-nucleotide adenylyltransferase